MHPTWRFFRDKRSRLLQNLRGVYQNQFRSQECFRTVCGRKSAIIRLQNRFNGRYDSGRIQGFANDFLAWCRRSICRPRLEVSQHLFRACRITSRPSEFSRGFCYVREAAQHLQQIVFVVRPHLQSVWHRDVLAACKSFRHVQELLVSRYEHPVRGGN